MSPELAQNAIFVLFGAAVFLGVEAAYLAIAKRTSYVRKVNTRLKLMGNAGNQHEVLVQLRRDRGLTSEGRYKLPLIWFNRLVLQSGLRVGIWRIAFLMVLAGLAGAGATLIAGSHPILAPGFARSTTSSCVQRRQSHVRQTRCEHRHERRRCHPNRRNSRVSSQRFWCH